MKLELINVTKSFNNQIIFDGLNLTIDHPGMYFLDGENGSGKTTLLNLISSFTSLDSGEIRINNEKASLEINKKYIGFFDVDTNLLDEITIEENLKLISDDYFDLIKKFNLEYLLKKKVNEISKGEKARIGIIKTLLSFKDILLFDEPFAYLDKDTANSFYNLMKSYSKNHIIIFTNHFSELEVSDLSVIKLESKKAYVEFKTLEQNDDKCEIVKPLKVKKSFLRNRKVKTKFILSSLFLTLGISTLIPSLNFALTSKKTLFNEIIDKEDIVYATISTTDEKILENFINHDNYSKKIISIDYHFKDNVFEQEVPGLYAVKSDKIKFGESEYIFEDSKIFVTQSAAMLLNKIDSLSLNNVFTINKKYINIKEYGVIEEFKDHPMIFIHEDTLFDYAKNSSFMVESKSFRLDEIIEEPILNKCILSTKEILESELIQDTKNELKNNEVTLVVPDQEINNDKLKHKLEALKGKDVAFNKLVNSNYFDLFSYVDTLKIKDFVYLKSDNFTLTGAPYGLLLSDELFNKINQINEKITPLNDGSNHFLITSDNLSLLGAEEFNQNFAYINSKEQLVQKTKFNALEAKDSIQVIFVLLSSTLILISAFFIAMYTINFVKQNRLNSYVLFTNGLTKKEVFRRNLWPVIFVVLTGMILGAILSMPLGYLFNYFLNSYSQNILIINYFPFNIVQLAIVIALTIIMLLGVSLIVYKKTNVKEVIELKNNK